MQTVIAASELIAKRNQSTPNFPCKWNECKKLQTIAYDYNRRIHLQPSCDFSCFSAGARAKNVYHMCVNFLPSVVRSFFASEAIIIKSKCHISSYDAPNEQDD